MDRIEADFRVVTPLFAGGARPADSVEIRAPAVKGMLRFWWRAMAWARPCYGGDLARIREEEAGRFGSTEGACPFRLRVRLQEGENRQDSGAVHPQLGGDRAGARYLGYGLVEAFGSRGRGTKPGQLQRPCIEPGARFTVELLKPKEIENDIVEALKVWGLLGGLGSRTRRGFGSLSLDSIRRNGEAQWNGPVEAAGYDRALKETLSEAFAAEGEPPYSAFNAHCRADRLVIADDPCDVLDQLGRAMVRYRSWGHNGKIFDSETAEQNFQDDHKWYAGQRPEMHPRRVVFGLPHNYSKKPKHKVKPAVHDRRASPLLLHVHRLDDAQYVGVSLVLRGAFLPPGEKIDAGGKKISPNPEWDLLDSFLEGKVRSTDEHYFPERERVLPE